MYTDEFYRDFRQTVKITRTVVYPGSSQDITKMSPVADEASELCLAIGRTGSSQA
jgi:hypothetical protein